MCQEEQEEGNAKWGEGILGGLMIHLLSNYK